MATERLLPPGSTKVERAVASLLDRVGAVPAPLAPLWDPATCPAELLPWLAWGFSVDVWQPGWSEATKRAAVAASLAEHRLKGTPAVVDAVLARFDALLSIVEWHETSPPGDPHTFDVVLELVTGEGVAPGGERATADFAERIIRDIYRVKPLREHMRMVQRMRVSGFIGAAVGAQIALFDRLDAVAAEDTDPMWLAYFQTEYGEPISGPENILLETE